MGAAEVRATQLDLLAKFFAFCDSEGLECMLAAGSLLGAVRHGGFIPWDDDVDVMMPRADYDELLRRASKLDQDGHTLLRFPGKHDPSYPYPYAKLQARGTVCVETIGVTTGLGVNLDVFPLDTWPAVQGRKRRLAWLVHNLGHVIRLRLWRRTTESLGAALGVFLLRFLLLPIPIRWVTRTITGLVVGAGVGRDGREAGIIVWGYHERVPISAALPSSPIVFEGLELRGPADPDAYLKAVYGDYRQLPPLEARVAPHASHTFRPAGCAE